ncbi:MAG: glycosyltransferase family 2 protein [Clostridium sp.]|uniref:glycosyltransferase family 2 protein n=1 Tax=Clostridium sp. TaxID=1506 RepID=UPI0029081FFB|nr:glycosyltransferase family 2 protein [Clostridium sp.]MDU7147859.1 glycosyltransferase family 2 protein [Clostridium sp.]MDU7241737.1 glycosyltransferase family 2 protein [Clostridium sp.]
MDLVSLVIINYNNKSYLERCINSIFNQTYKDLEIIFIDNESKDGSYDFMKEEYPNDDIFLIRNEVNNGYAGAANQGIKLSKGKYVMILNPDIIMEADFIEKMYAFIESDEKIGALSGKLLKYDFENDKKLNYIDSTGIIMYKSTRCIDRGQNEEDLGQYDNIEQVFGVCGAAPMYRKSALDKVKIFHEYFDEDFFAYKEDIDLSWRLNLAGFKNMYYHNAIAYHGRALGKSKGGVINFIKHRKKQSEFLKGISTRNHIMMLYKNNFDRFLYTYKKEILIRQIKLLTYCLIFENSNLKYIIQAINNKNKMELKKNYFLKNVEYKIYDINNLLL